MGGVASTSNNKRGNRKDNAYADIYNSAQNHPNEIMPFNRRAYHSGSWYSDNSNELDKQLTTFMKAAEEEMKKKSATNNNKPRQPLRATIVPHAGYSYSGQTAGFSYHAIQQELLSPDSPIRRILVLHPSHHVALSKCAVSGASNLETPLGNLLVDEELRQEILQLAATNRHKTTSISVMNQRVDEQEHSGEMQYPFLQKCILSSGRRGSSVMKVLPVMCGSISTQQEQDYGHLLAPIIAREDVLTVISSDFCHWGSRFSYQPTPPNSNAGSISKFIGELDHKGMTPIEMQQPGAFATYLRQTRNTICGRHPIAVWLHAIDYCNKNRNGNENKDLVTVEFIKYAQSSEVQSMSDSSVSYASAVARLREA